MSTFEDKFKEVLSVYLNNLGYEVTAVDSWEEDTYSGGYCETCAYDETQVVITYITGGGQLRQYTYSGKFTYLLDELLAVEVE